jgi:hypothetical protein
MTDLPHIESAQQIVDAIGLDAAMTVIARWGGTTINIPRAEPGPMLVQVLGVDVARLLCASLGPGALPVPRALAWLTAQRDREIALRAAAGETRPALAQRFGVSERRVYQILAAAQKEPA